MSGPFVSLNPNLRGMGLSPTIASGELARRVASEGRTVYRLGLGQSPFPVPDLLVQALRHSAHERDYLPVRGLPELRAAIAKHHAEVDGLDRKAEQVLVGPGSKELLFLAQLAYDGVLMAPAPSWVSYEPQARILGHRTQWLVTHRSDGWKLTAEALDAICSSEEPRPRLLVLNSPANPSGAVYEEGELRDLAHVANAHRILVLSDEIYGRVHHSGEHVSMARFYPDGTILASGLSKWAGAGGWRLGYMSFPPALEWLCDAMASAASETFTSTSAPIQHAAIRAFVPDPQLDVYLRDSRRILGAVVRWAAARFAAVGAGCGDPRGGFYLFPDLSAFREKLAAVDIRSSPSLCERALRDTGVAMLPGSAFGRPANELTVRIACVDFDGGAALAAASRVEVELDEAFVRAHCAPVVAGVEALLDWLRALS